MEGGGGCCFLRLEPWLLQPSTMAAGECGGSTAARRSKGKSADPPLCGVSVSRVTAIGTGHGVLQKFLIRANGTLRRQAAHTETHRKRREAPFFFKKRKNQSNRSERWKRKFTQEQNCLPACLSLRPSIHAPSYRLIRVQLVQKASFILE